MLRLYTEIATSLRLLGTTGKLRMLLSNVTVLQRKGNATESATNAILGDSNACRICCRLRCVSVKILTFYVGLLKGRMRCFSMQFVMNKCFLPNPEKNLAQIRLVVFKKNTPLIPKNDVTEPKARLL